MGVSFRFILVWTGGLMRGATTSVLLYGLWGCDSIIRYYVLVVDSGIVVLDYELWTWLHSVAVAFGGNK